MILESYTYWTFFASMILFILVYKDFKGKLPFEDKRNFFMLGLTFSLISHVDRSIWYLIGVIIIVLLLNTFLNRFKALGKVDINTLSWIFYGFAILNMYYLINFFIIFVAYILVYFTAKRILKITWDTPFQIIIFCSFVSSSMLLGLYS